MQTPVYSSSHTNTSWHGYQLASGSAFDAFLSNEVLRWLDDQEEKDLFLSELESLTSAGYAKNTLVVFLSTPTSAVPDWSVSEALAQAWLTREQGVKWPWNMARDKRTPNASLPGADLIGFVTVAGQTRLVLGEVKSSSDVNTPPSVMSGRTGMAKQLEKLWSDRRLLFTLLSWLAPRCRQAPFESQFHGALKSLFNSDYKSMTLFGVLVRDTKPSEKDLRARGQHLSNLIDGEAACQLFALYLPHSIETLFARATRSQETLKRDSLVHPLPIETDVSDDSVRPVDQSDSS